MKFGIHAYAWCSEWSNKMLHLIDRCKGLGLDFLEIPLMRLDLVDAEAIRARLEEAGLGVCCSTVLNAETDLTSSDAAVRRKGVRYLKDCVDACADMGSKMLAGVIYSEIGKKAVRRPSAREWQWSADGLGQVADYASDKGIMLGIEPVNRYETYLVNTVEQGLRLSKMIGRSNVRIHLDTYHMNIEEKSFYEAAKAAAGRICHIHACENDRGIPGTGLVDWDGLFRALAEQKYDGSIALESFVEVSDSMIAATCIWRDLAPSGDVLVREGLKFLRGMEKRYFGGK